MDDALALPVFPTYSPQMSVLILVVMDDALAPEEIAAVEKAEVGLNPCCNG